MAVFKRRCLIETKHQSNTEATTAPMGDTGLTEITKKGIFMKIYFVSAMGFEPTKEKFSYLRLSALSIRPCWPI